ncbi:MAG: lipid-A-disaccharide synthase [Caulobacteraceae bacterium]
MSPLTLMLTATEASADELGAGLVRALKARLGDRVRFVGVGGAAMAGEGVTSAFDIADLAILGALEGVLAYPKVLARVAEAAALADREKPDAAVLIDSWGFSQRVARRLRRSKSRPILIKYVAPQVWATRPGRAATLAKLVDHLLTINSFDPPLFEREGLPTQFVGNPAAFEDFLTADPTALRRRIGVEQDDPILLILPGSRRGEIDRLMPIFGQTAELLSAGRPRLALVIAAAESQAQAVRARLPGWPAGVRLLEGRQDRLAAMRAATAALACSGTVTTQLAAARAPMVVAYRLGWMTYLAAKLLIRTRYISLINVAAGSFVVPERVQGACTPKALARDLAPLLDDTQFRAARIAAQSAALETLRGGIANPAATAAEAIIEILQATDEPRDQALTDHRLPAFP